MPEDRRLAAIMFTDIVGYTALMGSDEDKAFEILAINREIHNTILSRYNGTLIKEMGDGILASFSSNSDAVRCAVEIQQEAKTENIKLRIGIHEGEMVFAGADVLGDGVNVASRLEELAEEGCINVSGAVYKDIRNKAGILAEFIEEKTLKNIEEPVKVYKVICEETEEVKGKVEPPFAQKKPSIAVLPFVNMSNDPEQEYFCDGMTEEIINALSRVGSIKVIARTSSFMFKGKHTDVREIGKTLNVEKLLEGSVRKAGNWLRITAQLITVADGSHIWSDAYNRELKDVFAIQEEISLAIVINLKVKLIGKERTAILKRYTEDMEAYNLILKGRYYNQMMTAEGLKKAIECFEKSLKRDSRYALAFSGLAEVYWYISYWGNMPPKEAYQKAKEYAGKALEIDDTLAEAHAALAFIYMNYEWNWKLADKEYNRAIDLNPNSALTYLYYSFLLIWQRRYEEAISYAKKSQELDPIPSYINTNICFSLMFGGYYDEAIEAARLSVSMNPNHFYPHYILGAAYRFKSLKEEAMKEYKKAVDLSGGIPYLMAILAKSYNELNKKPKAKKLIDSVKKRMGDEYVPSICFYLIHISLGDSDQAFEWLKRAINEHDSYVPWFITMPDEISRIPDEPRYNELLKKVGLEKKGT